MAAIKDSFESPNIIKSYLPTALVSGDFDCRFIKELMKFIKENEAELSAEMAFSTDGEKKIAIMQALSSMLFLCLFPQFFSGYAKLNFSATKIQEEYIETLLSRYSKRSV